MPWSALPDHIDEPEEWNNRDDDQHWYTRWRKSVKGWFAFGPRATEWWARFRTWPITLFAWFGEGESRWENDIFALRSVNDSVYLYNSKPNKVYLSRVQYWIRWHVQLAWPLFFCFHFYWKNEDVGSYPVRPRLKGWAGYIGFKRDADLVYWLGLYLGRSFK